MANNSATLTVNPTWKPDGMLPVDTVPLDEPKSSRATDVWTSYLTHADERDKARVESWKGDMDGILIFSGLFSAVTTAFIVETYKNLQPDNVEMSTQLLVRVVAALERTNTTAVGITPDSGPSSTISLWINALWFLSLLFSIICAIAATLVQQWSRKYLQRWSSARIQPGVKGRPGFKERTRLRARAHAYFSDGVDTFGLVFIVNCIPFVLHLALFLFVAGLVIFAFTINNRLAWLTLVVAIVLIVAYATVTILPAIAPSCPYRTPLSDAIQRAVDSFKPQADNPPQNDKSHAAVVEELLFRLKFDKFIISRTLGIWAADGDLTDANLEALFHAMPSVIQPVHQERPEESVEAMNALLFDKFRVGGELPRLLGSCLAPFTFTVRSLPKSRLLELEKKMVSRAKACLGLLGLFVTVVGQGRMNAELTREITDKCIYPALEGTTALIKYKTVDGQPLPWQWEVSCTTMLLVGFVLRNYHAALKTVERALATDVSFPHGFNLDVQELFKIRDRLRVILPAYVSEHLASALDMYIPPDNPLSVLKEGLERSHDAPTFHQAAELARFVSTELVRVKDAYRVFHLTVDMMRTLVDSRQQDLEREEKDAFDAMALPVDWTGVSEFDDTDRIRSVIAPMLFSESSRAEARDVHGVLDAPERNDVGQLYAANHGLVDEVVTRNMGVFLSGGSAVSVQSWKTAVNAEAPTLPTSNRNVYSNSPRMV